MPTSRLLLLILACCGLATARGDVPEAPWPELAAPLAEWSTVIQSMPAHPQSNAALDALLHALPAPTSRAARLLTLAEGLPDSPLGLYALETLWAEQPEAAPLQDLVARHADVRLGGLALDLLLRTSPDAEGVCAGLLQQGDTRAARLARVRLAERHAARGEWAQALSPHLSAFSASLPHDTRRAGHWYPALTHYYRQARLDHLDPEWRALDVADVPAQRHAALRLLAAVDQTLDPSTPMHALAARCADPATLALVASDPGLDLECRARAALVLASRHARIGDHAAFLRERDSFAEIAPQLEDRPETAANFWMAFLTAEPDPEPLPERSLRERSERQTRHASHELVRLLQRVEGNGGRGLAGRAARLFESHGRSEMEVLALEHALQHTGPRKDRVPLYKRLATVQWITLRDYAGAAGAEAWLARHMEGMIERERAAYATAVSWYLAGEYGRAMDALATARTAATVETRDQLLYLEALIRFREGRSGDALALLAARAQDPVPARNAAAMRTLQAYLQFAGLQESRAFHGYLEVARDFPEDRVSRTLRYFLGTPREPVQPVPTPPATPRAPNVLLISVDTMRADHLSSLGYPRPITPNLDALAARGVLCARAYSTSSWTKPAHASVFTGLYPQVHGAMQHDEALLPEFPVLAELLHARGFTTLGVISAPPLGGLFGFARGFQHYDDQTYLLDRQANLFMRAHDPKQVDIHAGYTASLITDSALRMLEAARAPERPFLLFINYFDAHHNYQPPATVAREWCAPYAGAQHGEIDRWNDAPTPLDVDAHEVDLPRLRELYGAELHHVDAQIGRVLGHLQERELLENTVVVVFSDHGDEFLEHQHLAHGRTLYNEVIHVPLIFAGPGVPAGQRIDQPVSLVDVAPTLLRLLGLPPAMPAHGQALLADGAIAPPGDRNLFAWLHLPPFHLQAAIQGGHKMIRDVAAGGRMLYDLHDDPGESRDAAGAHPEVALRIGADLDQFLLEAAEERRRWIGDRDTRVSAPRDSLDEMEEQLRALGYVAR